MFGIYVGFMCPLLTPKRVIYRFQEHMYEVYLRLDGAVVRHAGLSVIRVFLTIRGEEEKRFVHLHVCLLYKSKRPIEPQEASAKSLFFILGKKFGF